MNITNLARHVYKTLGHGHSESVYHRAMEVGLRKQNIKYDTERIVPIQYEGHVVGNSRLDLVIDDSMIVELKSVSCLKQKEITQLQNYMNLTGLKEGMLINFPFGGGDDIETHRVVSEVDDPPRGLETPPERPNTRSVTSQL